MRLGIGSYAFAWAAGVAGYSAPRHSFDAFNLVAEARDLGVHAVQICDNIRLPNETGELRKLLEQAEGADIELELGTRGTDPGHLMRTLEVARYLRSTLVRTMVIGQGQAGLLVAERELRLILPEYEKAGVTIVVENYEAQKALDLADMIRRIGSSALGACLDTVNSLGALEDLSTVTDALLPLALSIHIKDFIIRRLDHRMGFAVEGVPAGSGSLDIPLLFDAGASSGKNPGIILEQWTPWQGSIDSTVHLERSWARQSIAYLRRRITT